MLCSSNEHGGTGKAIMGGPPNTLHPHLHSQFGPGGNSVHTTPCFVVSGAERFKGSRSRKSCT